MHDGYALRVHGFPDSLAESRRGAASQIRDSRMPVHADSQIRARHGGFALFGGANPRYPPQRCLNIDLLFSRTHWSDQMLAKVQDTINDARSYVGHGFALENVDWGSQGY